MDCHPTGEHEDNMDEGVDIDFDLEYTKLGLVMLFEKVFPSILSD